MNNRGFRVLSAVQHGSRGLALRVVAEGQLNLFVLSPPWLDDFATWASKP